MIEYISYHIVLLEVSKLFARHSKSDWSCDSCHTIQFFLPSVCSSVLYKNQDKADEHKSNEVHDRAAATNEMGHSEYQPSQSSNWEIGVIRLVVVNLFVGMKPN